MAYLCFSLDAIPDLSLSKYAALDENGVEGVLKKSGSFLRQLNRKGILSELMAKTPETKAEYRVFFHLLYVYDPNEGNGQRLKVFFIASGRGDMLLRVRELVQNSAISPFYDINCYELVTITSREYEEGKLRSITVRNHLGHEPETFISTQIGSPNDFMEFEEGVAVPVKISKGTIYPLKKDSFTVNQLGLLENNKLYKYMAALGKREFFVQPSVILPEDDNLKYYKVAEWKMNEDARLYNMFKLMQGFNQPSAFRLDIFSMDYAQPLRGVLPIQELRKRTSISVTRSAATMSAGKDETADEILKQYNDIIENYESAPHFRANILAFADEDDVAQLIVDAAGAEALESGNYDITLVQDRYINEGVTVYTSMDRIVDVSGKDAVQHLKFMPNLYLLEELRPFFSFPALHDGESIQIPKETTPTLYDPDKDFEIDEKGNKRRLLTLGIDDNGYVVKYPLRLLKKHAFLAGVPGSGKTNSMLHIASSLWKVHRIPFLILEPAKKEYRALTRIEGMDDLLLFSPSSGTKFPLHINPFEFPHEMSLSEHIRNLMSVFEGAFQLEGAATHLTDRAIETVYRNKGWYPDTINNGKLPYPTMRELYYELEEAVEKTDYDGELKGNIKSFIQVRLGSLLLREMGDVFDVPKSTLMPEEWLTNPVLIELEAMGTGPANFLSLLLSTLIRESLKIIRPSTGVAKEEKKEVRHVIMFEEAHNLIGPVAQEVSGEDADPKMAATAYVVKMLAEVRALDEAIIIADQLPTAMAPEVIKNTGLKIGHRLTSEDDRELIGGTMSANPTQLEEMATFLPGDALVSYEGLLRPFKARIEKWQQDDDLYNPPSNEELVSSENMSGLLTNGDGYLNKGYSMLLIRSAKICYDKFSTNQKEIENAIDDFLEDNAELTHKIRKLDQMMIENDVSSDEFLNENTNNEIIKAIQVFSKANERLKQSLLPRLIVLFEEINELMVKQKGYILQNAVRKYKEEIVQLLLELEEYRSGLFDVIKDRYPVCVEKYMAFSEEINGWGLSKEIFRNDYKVAQVGEFNG